jgi:hypothetical protein
VQYSRDGNRHFGRVDSVFVLDNFDDRYIFIILTPVYLTGERHKLLDLAILQAEPEGPIIVGVTAIMPVSLYMVPVEDVGIIWVEWEPHLL